jgi:adenylate cyclase
MIEIPATVRRLAAILAADVAGYSRLMGADEEGTLERLKALRRELLDPKIAEHKGRIVKTTGDGLLVEFASVVDAVRCAVAVQQAMPERNAGVSADSHIELRIGINLGDVIVEDDDLYGDGVNIAARIEALADAGGVFVSNTVHDHVRDRLPFVFEDLGDQQVKNIARPVRVYRVRPEGPHPSPPPQAGEGSASSEPKPSGLTRGARVGATEAPPLALPDKPSIAVLPFANMSGDPEQEYFADGMVEEIITALSRIRWLFVIARNSSFTYKGQALDVKQVGRELGVRYVLEGSVRRAGGRVRITAQLIEAEGGAHLWADRFDGPLEEVFELQDNVALSVAGVIESAVQAAEIRRSAERPTSDLTAYDLYLRALPDCLSWDDGRVRAALARLEEAIERDPQFGPALGFAAVCNHALGRYGGGKGTEAHRRAALDLAHRALQASPGDAGVIANAALMLGSLGEDIKPAIALVDRALELNPSFARGWGISAWLRMWAGQPDVAVEHWQTSIRLSPRDRNLTEPVLFGLAHFFRRRFDDAITFFLTALANMPRNPEVHRDLAACYALTGRLEEARQILDRLRTITPVIFPHIVSFRDPEHRELFLSGLRLAMGEAT